MQICAESKFIVKVFSIVCFLLKCKAIVYWGVYVYRKTTEQMDHPRCCQGCPYMKGLKGHVMHNECYFKCLNRKCIRLSFGSEQL
jgi:hypothetical protein